MGHTWNYYKGVAGWFDYEALYDKVVEKLNGGLLVEVGNFIGGSFLYLADRAKESGKPFQTLAVDIYDVWDWANHEKPRGYEECPSQLDAFLKSMKDNGYNPTKYPGNNKNFVRYLKSFSWDAPLLLSDYDKSNIKFAFIDAGHGYQEVVNDIKAWEPLVQSNGIIAGHDYNDGGVKRAVHDTLEDAQAFSDTTWIYYK